MYSIFTKEISTFFNSLVAYLVITVFLTFIGLYLWVFPETSILDFGYADPESLFTFGPIAFLLLIPAITMRTFAEERKEGTIELLLTWPVSDLEIILGKFLASLCLVLFSLLPTLVYYISIYQLGSPVGNIDSAAMFTSYTGLFLLGAVFTSIGIFSSAITKNQIIAFIVALVLCYFLYDGLDRIASINWWGESATFILSLSLNYHYQAMSKGMIDLRDIFFFLSIIVSMLLFTRLILGSRKW